MRWVLRKVVTVVVGVVLVGVQVILGACSEHERTWSDAGCVAVCRNGRFAGRPEAETGVLAFKGIPYAKAPIGALRWKAPVRTEDSDELVTAYEFGRSSIQYEWFSEDIQTEVGEDCLTLNVWTSDLAGSGKPVMFYIHGGSYAWGGTSEPLYNGQYIVASHPDVLVVTCNYRVGIMGMACFEGIPGGEEYEGSQNLAVLDLMMGLEWVRENIRAFGGDPDNVTIFGESAGGGMVSSLLATDQAGRLFHRAIVQSGPPSIILPKGTSVERRQRNVKTLMQISGCSTMAELCSLTEEELIGYNDMEIDGEGTTINDLYTVPMCGVYPIPDDIYESMLSSRAKGVDLMIGTNLDELNYWICEMGDKSITEMSEEEKEMAIALFSEWYIPGNYDNVCEGRTEEEISNINKYLDRYGDMEDYLAKSRILSDIFYRMPSIKLAQSHAKAGGGSTYMYMFEKRNSNMDILGAVHSQELPYVFLNYNDYETYGEIDRNLACKISDAWVNFARTGRPSAQWPEYDENSRQTMVFGDDGSLNIVSDPYSKERELLEFTWNYSLRQSGGL